MVTKQDRHFFSSAVLSMTSILHLFFFVIMYNFTEGHIISLSRCAPLLLSIISFSVINSVFVINTKWRKNRIQVQILVKFRKDGDRKN